MRFPIIKRSLLWVTIGAIWMLVCAFLFFSNIRLSKQFTGGIEFKLDGKQTAAQVQAEVQSKLADENLRISADSSEEYTNVLIQQISKNEDKLLEHNKTLQAAYAGRLKEFAIVWPSIGKQVSSTAVQAIIWWLILMSLFIVFEFSKIRKFIQPWILAIITIFTMLFDVLSPMGIYGIVMGVNATAQVDVIFIIALLTTMWYSINDTIIIFDRVREHLEKDKSKSMADLFETSLWETMSRSLMTVWTTLIVLTAMYFLWTGDLKNFAFVVSFWVLSGSFSSIFLASPLAYLIMKRSGKAK